MIPKIQKIDAVLSDRGNINEMLELSSSANKLAIEVNKLFMQSKVLHENDIEQFTLQIADLLLNVDIARRSFGIKREDIQKRYDEMLEIEFSKIDRKIKEEQ